jgi:SHS2 domain-containing protein
VLESGFEIFEVTADQGIHAWAPDLPGLFRVTALGLWSLMVEPAGVGSVRSVPVTVEAPDRELLLVAWLNELLYLHEVEAIAGADVRIEALTETRLQATVQGETLDPSRHRVVGHVKAVTYHDLRVAATPGGWEARVVVDV